MWIELVSNFEIVPTCCIFVYIVELKRKSHCIFCNRFFLWFFLFSSLQTNDWITTKRRSKNKGQIIVWTNMLHDIWLQKQKIKYKNWDIHFKTIKAYVCQVFLSRSSILPAGSDVCSPWAACPLLSSCIPVMGGRGSPDPSCHMPPPLCIYPSFSGVLVGRWWCVHCTQYRPPPPNPSAHSLLSNPPRLNKRGGGGDFPYKATKTKTHWLFSNITNEYHEFI